jgi:Leucine-rich repeat (LRR) protein
MKNIIFIRAVIAFLLLFSINILSAQDYYWVGGLSNNWSDVNNWADVSGGVGGAIYELPPGVNNNVIFDENSFSGPATVVVTEGSCFNMDWSGLDELVTLEIPVGEFLEINGDVTLNANLTINGSGPITFNSADFPNIQTFGVVMPDLNFNVPGAAEVPGIFTLIDNIDAKSISIGARANLSLNGNSLTIGGDLSLSATNSQIDAENSEITIGGSFTSISEESVGVNFSGSTINMTGTATGSIFNFNTSSLGTIFENVIFSGGKEYTLQGSSSFSNLKVTDGTILSINSTAFVNISDLVLDGEVGNLVTLRTQNSPLQAGISISNSSSVYYANIENITVLAGNYPAFYSNDLDGNTGWVFLTNDDPIEPIVTSNADSGLGTLREALTLGSPYVDNVISFNIPGDNNTITLESPLDVNGIVFTISGAGETGLTIAGSSINQFFIDGSALLSTTLETELILSDIIFDFTTGVFGNLNGQFINTKGDLIFVNCSFLSTSTSGSLLIKIDHSSQAKTQSFTIDNSNFFDHNTTNGGLIEYRGSEGDGELTFGCTFYVANSYFLNNIAGSSDGGAIRMLDGGTLIIEGSTFEGNSGGDGGATYMAGQLEPTSVKINATIINSTFTGNNSPFSNGGAIFLSNTDADIISSTIVGNTATSGAGLYLGASANVNLISSIVAGNNDSGVNPADIFVEDNGSAILTSLGYNFYGDITYASNPSFTPVTGDISSNDPQLDALADNGGSTPTMLPSLGSAVIDAGDPNSVVTTDQRGFQRVGTPDIGAVESGSRDVQIFYVAESLNGTADGLSWGNETTLQNALSQVIDGDEIWLTQGTYLPDVANRNFSFNIFNNISIYGGFIGGEQSLSERDPEANVTILSGDLLGNDVVTFNSATGVDITNNEENTINVLVITEVDNVLLDGITILGGNANDGNTAGGAVYLFNGNLTLKNVTITGNSATSEGGGIYGFTGSELKMIESTIINNSAGSTGGGVYLDTSRFDCYRCTFSQNSAANSGGGLVIFNSNPTNSNSSFLSRYENNIAVDVNSFGGGISILKSNFLSFGDIVDQNLADASGGGLFISDSDVDLINATIARNEAATGSAIASSPGETGSIDNIIIANSIIWDNLSDNTTSEDIISLLPQGETINIDFSNSVIQNWDLTEYSSLGTALENLIVVDDPQFLDSQNGDYTPSAISSALGLADQGFLTGFNDLYDEDEDQDYSELLPFDALSNDRFFGGRLDAGALQFQGEPQGGLYYVNAAATGTNEGTSWADAFTSLQNALLIASSENYPFYVFYLSEGTYTPTPSADRTATFVIQPDFELYGGFPATGDPVFEDRDPNQFTTILSGNIGILEDNSDNSFHVMEILGGVGQSLIDGVTIAFGNANSEGVDQSIGAGILIEEGANTLISNINIENNSADSDGGGIYIKTNSDVFVQNGYFFNNSAVNDGGALYSRSSFSTAAGNPISHSEFSQNSAGNNGGGLYLEGNKSELVNSIIYTNSAVNNGGGVHVSGEITVTSSNIIDNFITSEVGIGAGIFRTGTNNFTISNSIIYGNNFFDNLDFTYQVGDDFGDGINMAISFSIVQNSNFEIPPYNELFTTDTYSANPDFIPDSFIPSFTSPAIDAGLENFLPADVYDLDGDDDIDESIPKDFNLSARVFGASVDIGAFEQQTTLDEVQRTALAAIYDALDGDNWTDNTNWKTAASLDQWFGVDIHEISGYVIGLGLGENNLSGTIPAEIGDLTLLENLDFFGNQITGNIPSEIGVLTQLNNLDFRNNLLTGGIPDEIYELSNLTRFGFGANLLTGSISPLIGNLTNLTFIDIGANNLTGTIPEEIGNISGLVELYIADAPGYTGGIPLSFINLSSLNIFGFQNTNLCEPSDPSYQSWKSTVSEYTGSGLVCGATVAYPQNVTTKMVSGTQAVVRWEDDLNEFSVASPVTYTIERSEDGISYALAGNFSISESISPNVYIFVNDGLTDGIEYLYRVKAGQNAEETIYSNVASVTLAPFDFELETETYFELLPTTFQSLSWTDFNDDSFQDVFLGKFTGTISRSNILWKGSDAPEYAFTEVPGIGTASLTQSDITRSSTWGDFDNDNIPDIIVPTDNLTNSTTRLYLNKGDETFKSIELAIPDPINGVTTGDFNQDGLLDFAMVSNPGLGENSKVIIGLSNVQQFVDGVENHYSLNTITTSIGLAWSIAGADYDNNGTIDLFIPSREGNAPLFLIGLPDGSFNQAFVTGLTDVPFASSSVAWVDIDNDNDLDLVIAGLANDPIISTVSKVFLNDGLGALVETSAYNLPGQLRGLAFGDYDNDGDLDLFSSRDSGKFFENTGSTYVLNEDLDFKITDLEFLAGAATVDFNNDGKLDFATVGDALQLYKNTNENGNNYLEVKLSSLSDNNSAIGAKVIVFASPNVMTRTISGQTGYGGQSSNILHFGLGVNTIADVTVTWPDGEEWILTSQAANQVLDLEKFDLLDKDSVALVDLYRFTNGANWTSKTNWFQNTVDNWQGVIVNQGRVEQLDLKKNNLKDSLPNSFSDLNAVLLLDLDTNELVSLPDFSFMSPSSTVRAVFNRLVFDDIAPNIPVIASLSGVFNYSPQRPFGAASTRTVNFGETSVLSFPISLGAGTVYQWIKGADTIPGAISASYSLAISGPAQAGVYKLRATRPDVPGLILESEGITINVNTISQDIDALRTIYTALGGANWTTNTNWTQNEDVPTWFGVTLNANLRVTAINLPNNNLVGTIPNAILNLPFLQTLNVSGNSIIGLPTLTAITTLSSVNISNNNLFFPQITPNVGVAGIVYQPQKAFGKKDTLRSLLTQEVTFNTQLALTTTGNVYRWRLAEIALTKDQSDQQLFNLTNIELADAGNYTLAVTNPAAPLLTLLSDTILLKVINEYPVNLRDSLAAVAIYDALGGAGWPNRANWRTDSLKKWQGVTLTRGNVSSLVLQDNNLKGTFPTLASDQLNSLEILNLSNNTGVLLPASISNMTSLSVVNFSNMGVSAVPTTTGISGLSNAQLGSNALQFGDIEPYRGAVAFGYIPQEQLGQEETRRIDEGTNISLPYPVRGTNLTNVWYKNDVVVSSESTQTLTFPAFLVNDNGVYNIEVKSSILPDLTLTSKKVTLVMKNSIADSLALRRIYNELGGENWTRKTNWLSARPVAEWEGVTYANGKVRALDLNNNNLVGSLSAFTGFELSELTALNLEGNEITAIPSLNGLVNLTQVAVENNFLQFASLEAQGVLSKFTFVPQKVLLEATDEIHELGTSVVLSRIISGAQNTYQWYKDGNAFGSTTTQVPFEQVAFTDEGDYTLEIKNGYATTLTLTTQPITLYVASLERDTRVLQALFDALGGATWTGVAANWRTNPIGQPEVTLNALGTRVVGINLSGKGLSGEMPRQLRTMTDLTSLDLSNNSLSSVPSLTNIVGLTNLNVSNNRLQFQSIQNNLAIQTYSFSPQATISANTRVRQPQGTKATLSAVVRGSNLTYQWYFKDNTIIGATAANLDIEPLEYENIGFYHCRVVNIDATLRSPGFFLRTGDFLVEATANIEGAVANLAGNSVDGGKATLYRIAPIGTPFPPIDTSLVVGSRYVFENIVLNDFIIRVVSSDAAYLATYATSDVTWDVADTIKLRRDAIKNTVLQVEPDPLVEDPDAGVAVGRLELEEDDFPEFFTNTTGRTNGRRGSGNVGVAFSRLRATNRTEDDRIFEFIAYILTDENGDFEVGNLPIGTYKINFDFPGIPTDPTSFVEFDLGGGGTVDKNKIQLYGDITRTGIIVSKVEETGIKRSIISEMKAYPVPFDQILNLEFNMMKATSGDYDIQLMTVDGKLVSSSNQYISEGRNKIQMNVPTVGAGVYLIVIADENGAPIFTGKIIK